MTRGAVLERNLTEFFRDLLQDAMRSQEVSSSEATEFYLVKLLEGFARVERDWNDRPLALEYLESFHSPPPHRYGKLKRVADTSLFMAGLFMESLHRSLVTGDYYSALGRTAYHQLAGLWGEGVDAGNPFTELSNRFPDFVRVLTEISFGDLFKSDEHTLRVYTRWMYTRSERDAQWLMRQGITPFEPPKGRAH
ncbi:MAG TPA: hypothetical protein VMT89_02155 [Candidatus Acidoferrales bacterium]|nr:hypothetical protein [Candidatus Acidoferrales bacterium]